MSYGPSTQNYPAQQSYNILAILGFVFAFVFSPAGLVLSILGLKAIKREGTRGRGLALAGLILSIISIVLFIIYIVVFVLLVASDPSMTTTTY